MIGCDHGARASQTQIWRHNIDWEDVDV